MWQAVSTALSLPSHLRMSCAPLYLLSQALQGCNLQPDATSIKEAELVSSASAFIFALQLHPMPKKSYPRNWRSTIAPIIRIHYSFTCQLCNSRNASLHVHHIDGDTLNNTFHNLIPLCPKCHRKAESGQFLICQVSRGGSDDAVIASSKLLDQAIAMLRAEG